MQGDLLPIFPLSIVLLPHNDLPLHIFEDRYKEMMAAVLRAGSEFGVVLAAQGGIASAGCTAAVVEVVKRYDDGRMDVLTSGRRRFHIRSLDQELSYLRGGVEFFEDGPDDSSLDLRERAILACDATGEQGPAADSGDTHLSFRLAGRFDDLMFRQELLVERSEAGRLRKIVDYAPGYADRRRETERIREVAGKNGHSRNPPKLDLE